MASELESGPLEETGRERWEEGDGCEDALRDGGGGRVSPSKARWSSIRVASMPESTGWPHAEQYRLASEVSLEQEGQRMTSGDCITATENARRSD
jgi:hypothetical protein